MNTLEDRKLAAKLGRQIMEEKISFSQFSKEFPKDKTDAEIVNLFDLIEHQPKQGGFWGLSKKKFDLYNLNIMRTIEYLEK